MKTALSLVTAAMLACPSYALERLEPAERCYFGITVGSGITVDELRVRLGITPAVYVNFYSFPLTVADESAIRNLLEQAAAVQGMVMLTLEPFSGLDVLTQDHYEKAADLCAYGESLGVTGIFIRFGHEMNGNWYAWGQQPESFKNTFREFAAVIHRRTTRTAMVWAPNYGVGYPFGNPRPAAGSEDFQALDTNTDGVISDKDDMYEPYYPGDDAVDWVGMTLYHWGVNYPWLENELAPAGSFRDSLIGQYQGRIPNFYERYCLARGKPMAVGETAAFYNTERDGPNEISIKQGWWQQVIETAPQFPKLKCINWFDEYKRESVAQNNLIDWRISANPIVRRAFLKDLMSSNHFIMAPEAWRAAQPPVILTIRSEGANVSIDWLGRRFDQYRLFASNLGGVWSPVTSWISGREERIFVNIPTSTTRGAVIFRVQLQRER